MYSVKSEPRPTIRRLAHPQAIPDGLLVFMPSYSLLDRLMQRWKVGGAGAGLG